MADVIITEFMDEAAVERIRARYETIYDPKLVDAGQELLKRLPQARALIVRNRTAVRGELLAAAGRLECVGRLGVGLDNIDVDACRARGIAVYPATGANDLSVAEYVMTAALLLLRGAYGATAVVAAGEWPRQRLIGREVSGRVMGLVGYGAIAREVARRAAAFGMEVMAFDPFLPAGDARWAGARSVAFDELLEASHVISLHVPLSEGTRHMIDAGAISKMRRDAILINAARGGVVDEQALAAALRAGRLGGAALDVFEVEPLTADAGAAFSGIDNLILTPHIAGVTEESNVRVSNLIAETVLHHLDGMA
ncbi:NAD(P)-dependent oxidoreductase [Chelativorans intermedius]|uniref:NAD(P)-dependent oxidoreductase n=1 Tax=Chelativorans intermedius TaxID=515947 RepID=A0ABV6DAQ6_9HYPH|nr:NAD(P)-dependent oxidoreductase [Chelativorans intermedius]MCT9000122.1 3-phosphoglycerate dehydrogenase [Chelativorans intermedius]